MLAPRHRVSVYSPLLSFGAPVQQANAALDLGIPQTYVMRSSGSLGYATFRNTDGSLRLRVFDPGVPVDWALQASGSTTIGSGGTQHAMRAGLLTDQSGDTYVFTAIASGSQIQVRRAQLTGTSNPVTASFSNYGPVFGPPMVNVSSFVRRVEAVCPTDAGVIVAVGEHDFTNQLSTVTFWYLPDTSTAVQLNALIQMPLTEGYLAWYASARHCSFISAASDLISGKIVVVANAAVAGRAVTFSIQNGAESALRGVLPIDRSVTAITFLPAGLTRINGMFYLTGRLTRRRADGAILVAYDGYVIGDAHGHFSFGERSHFIQTPQANGTLLLAAGGATVYYGGNRTSNGAAATPVQNPALPGANYSPRLLNWTLDQGADGADSVSMSLENSDGGLTGDVLLRGGTVAILESGQEGTFAEIGRYVLDRPREGVSTRGREPMRATGLSLGGRRLMAWKAPMPMQLMARSAVRSNLAELAGLLRKTPERGYTLNNAGLVFDGLNEPFIAFADEYDHGDSLTHLVAQCDVDDPYHLTTIGVLIGAGDDGRGNLFVIPKVGTWGADTLTGPQMRRLRLNNVDPSEPDREDTGWNFSRHTNGLVRAVSAANRRSDPVLGSYPTGSTATLAAGAQYGIVVRVSGRRAQLFTRPWNLAPNAIAANAQYTLQSEFLFGYDAQKDFSDTPRSGIAISTDVWHSTTAFDEAALGEMVTQLTLADDLGLAYFTRLVGSGPRSSVAGRVDIGSSLFQAGQSVRLVGASTDFLYTIRTAGAGYIDLYDYRTTTPAAVPGSPGTTFTAYLLAAGDTHGFADSGSTNNDTSAGRVTTETGAIKQPIRSAGRALFVTDDSSAGAIRYIETDGVRHDLWSGSLYNGGTYEGWDATSPESVPSVWRMVFNHGRFFTGSASAFGLPTGVSAPAYFKVDDEIIRYMEQSFSRRGVYPGDAASNTVWTVCPVWYAPLAATPGATNVLRNWRASGGQQPGDDLGLIPNAAGLLVEVMSRNSSSDRGAGARQYYAQGVTFVASPTPASTSFVTLTANYPSAIRGPSSNQGGDVIAVSGRGQFGTHKAAHEPGAPVVYCPVNSAGDTARVTLSSYRFYSGSFRSLRDVIDRVARLAGLRDIQFRTAFSTPTATVTQAITTTPATLPARESLTDFVLRMQAFLPRTGRLNIYFRDYYRLTLRHHTTDGVVLVGLATTRTAAQGGVDADGSGDRWLGYAYVPVQAWLPTTETSRNVEITLAVIGDEVILELNGQPVWTWDLSLFVAGATSYNVQTAGPIQIEYTTAQAGNSATFELLELYEEMGDVVIDEAKTAQSVIASTIGDRHVRSRTTQTGGVLFSQFWLRDDAGTLRRNLLKHNWSRSDRSRVSHQKVVSEDGSGEVLDVAVTQADGYEFHSMSVDTLATPRLCQDESRLLQRENEEFSEEHELEGYGRLAPQPEDRVQLQYLPGGDMASQAGADLVITGVSLSAQPGAVRAKWTLRRFRSMP